MIVCPCCLQSRSKLRPEALLGAHIVGTPRAILRELVSHPDGISAEELASRVYGTTKHLAPDSKTISMAVSRLRTMIEPYGYTIPKNKKVRGATYRLAPLEVSAR